MTARKLTAFEQPEFGEVFEVSPAELMVHRFLGGFAAMGDDDPEFLSLVEDIRERGIDYPIIVDERMQILDGRHRWRAARAARLDTVPVVQRPGQEAASIILAALVQRRHYTKGALAYMTVPLFESVVEESRQRRRRNLLKGGSRKSSERTIGEITVDSLAEQLGFGRNLFFQAKELRAIFAKSLDYRDAMEPKVLSGEVGLGGAIAGFAGYAKTKDQPRPPKRSEPQLFLQGFDVLTKRVSYFSSIEDPVERDTVARRIRRSAAEWPEDLIAELVSEWRKAGKL